MRVHRGQSQGAYLIPAARSLVLDCGPLSGFDNAKVDAELFPAPAVRDGEDDVMPAGRIQSNFLCNLGYADPAGLHSRNPRLELDEACNFL